MADALDYLGHPCKIAEARVRFAEQIGEARAEMQVDPRRIPRGIGLALNELDDRVNQMLNAIEAALQALPNDDDADSVRAILTMMQPYGVATANQFGTLAGQVLVALEQPSDGASARLPAAA